jgi:hypothetical protein
LETSVSPLATAASSPSIAYYLPSVVAELQAWHFVGIIMLRKKPSKQTSLPKKKQKKPTEDRARFIIDQCPHRITGEVNLPWGQLRSPEHESALEGDAIYVLVMCWDVHSIMSQPERINYTDENGMQRRYTADLLLTLDAGTKRIEIKPLAICLKEDVIARMLDVAQVFAKRNEIFDILTDDVIRQQPRLDICRRLRGFLKQSVSDEVSHRVCEAFGNGPLKVSDLLVSLGGERHWADVLAMVAHRQLCISWQEPYSKDMQVSLPNLPFSPLTYVALTNSGRFCPLVQKLALGCRPTDQRLLAAARAENRSISLPDPFGVVGSLPQRAMQVGRTDGRRGDGRDGDGAISETGLPGHFGNRNRF